MSTNIFSLRNIGLALCVSVFCDSVNAQSFNLDLNIGVGSEAVGNGVPSTSFGAAADQPGFWNTVPAQGAGAQTLRNLDGTLSNVVFTAPLGGAGHGYNNPNLLGDFRLLMSDGREVGDDTWSFSNLEPGVYHLYSYAVAPVPGFVTNTSVTVDGAIEPVQIVTGPIPANQFIYGITHSVHEISIVSGSFSVRVQHGNRIAYVNGFQLVGVPEPSLILTLGLGAFIMRLKKRRR